VKGAFAGKYLRVNLTEGTTAVEELPALAHRMYLGGAAMAASLLLQELKPGVDPLGPDNVMVISTCPLNGIPLSASSRFSVAAKSPLTGGYGEGEAGGFWGPELKAAGFDGIIVTGSAAAPAYLWIQDGQAELRDAPHLWGKLSGEVQELLLAETDKHARIQQCGIAGERGNLMAKSAEGILPMRNFQEGQFEFAKQISGQTLAETILTRRGTCYACAFSCKRQVDVPERLVSAKYGGPEYETIASSGSACGIGHLSAIAKFHQICGEYVMDTISVGMTIAWAMECFEKGLLSPTDTDGVELRFGNAEAMLTMAEKIGRREGFGELLSLGSERAAKQVGRGAEEFVLTVKKQEIPMHEPRGKQGVSLAYATAPAGADHMRAPHDPLYEGFHPNGAHGFEPLGLAEPMKRLELSPRKVRAYYYASNWYALCSCAGVCHLASAPGNAVAVTLIVDVMRALTGWDTSLWELLKVGERSKALARVFNCREGFLPKDDRLPKRLHEAFTEGPLAGVRVEPETFRRALRLYHQMEGWDPETGWPTFARLAELGIEWATRDGDGW
jgi:aldehyde:ferredoxin oxidoreductase